MSRNIEEYEVFQLAHALVLKIYQSTQRFPPEEKFGLVLQMRRSAYSIPMNLVEGGMRLSPGEFKQFVNIARGSCAEVQYQLRLAHELEYICQDEFDSLNSEYASVGRMLTNLMKKLRARGQKPSASTP